MAKRGRSSAPPPRKPETAAELAPLLLTYAVKQLDRGNGDGADWSVIAEAMLRLGFDALDKRPDDPRTHALLRRIHSGAENRITQNPAYAQELFRPDTDKALLNTFGFDVGPPAPNLDR